MDANPSPQPASIIFTEGSIDVLTAIWIIHQALNGEYELYPMRSTEHLPPLRNRDIYLLNDMSLISTDRFTRNSTCLLTWKQFMGNKSIPKFISLINEYSKITRTNRSVCFHAGMTARGVLRHEVYMDGKLRKGLVSLFDALANPEQTFKIDYIEEKRSMLDVVMKEGEKIILSKMYD